MTQSEIKDLRDLLLGYLKNNSDKNFTEIADIVMDENPDMKIGHRTIRGHLSVCKKQLELDAEELELLGDKTQVLLPPEELYQESELPLVVGDAILEHITTSKKEKSNDVTIEYAGTTYNIGLYLLDKIFCAYSKKGLGLTGPVVKSMFNLDDSLFRAVTTHFSLNKESAPYSPISATEKDEEELFDYLSSLVSDVLNEYIENDGSVTAQLNKSYKEEIIKAKNSSLRFNATVNSLKDLLPKVKITPMTSALIPNTGITHLVIPDMHIGLEQVNYNKQIVREKLREILHLVDMSKEVHVHFMGDIIHSVSGLNHPDTWKSMGKDDYGANAIINPYKILMEFLVAIPNLKKVTIVGGNHDRMAADKKMEYGAAEGAKLLAFMLDSTLVDIPVEYDHNMIIDNSDPNLVVVNMHGDNSIDKASGQSVAWEYGDKSKFTCIQTAHLHSRKQEPKDDGLKFRKTQLTAFCPIDSYGKTVAHGSLPGVLVIESNYKTGLPTYIDYPLYYD